MRKKRFGDYSGVGKAVVLALSAASLAVIATAERDLQGREQREIRGSKLLWRLWSLNALGAVAYLVFGRRR